METACALTASAPVSSEVRAPRWLGLRLDEIDLNNGRLAEVFRSPHGFNSPTLRKLLIRADRIADAALGEADETWFDGALEDDLLLDLVAAK